MLKDITVFNQCQYRFGLIRKLAACSSIFYKKVDIHKKRELGDSNYLSKREKEKGTDHEGQSPEMVLAIFALDRFSC